MSLIAGPRSLFFHSRGVLFALDLVARENRGVYRINAIRSLTHPAILKAMTGLAPHLLAHRLDTLIQTVWRACATPSQAILYLASVKAVLRDIDTPECELIRDTLDILCALMDGTTDGEVPDLRPAPGPNFDIGKTAPKTVENQDAI